MQLLVFAAACAAGAGIGLYIPPAVPGAPLFGLWPPTGILLAALVQRDHREWAAWLGAAGLTVAAMLRLGGHGWPDAIGAAALTAVEAAVAALLLRRAVDAPFTIERVNHIWALIAVSILVPMVTAAAAAAAATLPGDVVFATAWRAWWLGSGLGILLFGAFMTALMRGPAAFVEPGRRAQIVEAIAVIGAGMIVAHIVFGGIASPIVRVPAYMLPVLLWGAFRLPPGGALATLLAVCLVGLLNTSRGTGPFNLAGSPLSDWILRSQGAIFTASISFMLLAAVVAERKQTARERIALLAELQQALAEIKTLRGLIPICAWCQKVRDDAGFWQGIEAYVHTHTDATFSHSICPECSRGMHDEIRDNEKDRMH